MKYRSAGANPALPKRTLDYLQHGASEGCRNAELFDAACQCRDAEMDQAQAEARLIDRALADGLSETEARTTIRSAYTQVRRLRAGPSSAPLPNRPIDNNRRGKVAQPFGPVAVPAAIPNGFETFLDTAFCADEFVAIAPAVENEEGEVVPKRGVTLTREEWKQKVRDKGGIDHCFSTSLGLFIRVNPMKKGGAKNEDVVVFRHVLVEFDRDQTGNPIPKESQYGVLLNSGLPISVLIDSGNKSLHAWVRVDALNAAEYKRRVDMIWALFEGHALDRQNRNASRLSRCPDGRRTIDGEIRVQKLLALNLGAKSWDEWEAVQASNGLPKIIAGPDFMATLSPEPPQIIRSVLHQGCKMIIGGASKSRKSWTLIDMMLAISSGEPWWGFPTQRGRALYINFELPDFAFQHRLRAIAAAKRIDDYSGFDLWNLRGYATDFSVLIPKILARIKDGGYSLIVLDPIYKGLGKRDENKAGDIASLCNEIEQLAVQSGAAVVFGAHYSKGNQAGKEAIDRIGGSGVFARDPDVILTMTPHEEKDAYVIDLTLRALPQVDPFVVRWSSVVFERDGGADASRIRKPGTAAKAVAKCTYRKGGVAEKYSSHFEQMPPRAHCRPEKGESEVLNHIKETLATIGEGCDLEKARRIFDCLRNKKYEVITFEDGLWQGSKYDGSVHGQGGRE